jgi:hypothetical protein
MGCGHDFAAHSASNNKQKQEAASGPKPQHVISTKKAPKKNYKSQTLLSSWGDIPVTDGKDAVRFKVPAGIPSREVQDRNRAARKVNTHIRSKLKFDSNLIFSKSDSDKSEKILINRQSLI